MAEAPAFLAEGSPGGPWLPGELWQVLGEAPAGESDHARETHEVVVAVVESLHRVDGIVEVPAEPSCGHPHRHHQQRQQRYRFWRRQQKQQEIGVHRAAAGAQPRGDRHNRPSPEVGGQHGHVMGDTGGPEEAEGAEAVPDGQGGEGEDLPTSVEEHEETRRQGPVGGERPETAPRSQGQTEEEEEKAEEEKAEEAEEEVEEERVDSDGERRATVPGDADDGAEGDPRGRAETPEIAVGEREGWDDGAPAEGGPGVPEEGPEDARGLRGPHRSLRSPPSLAGAAPPPRQLPPGATTLASRPLRCGECGKAFVQVGQLARHRRIHTGERPFCCAECGRRFTQSAHLKQHARTHTGERPFACAECGKRFAQSCQLGVHRRSHTGEKPYPCGDCGKAFSGSSALRRHRRSHTGERPFACAECGKRFARGWLLALHARTHTGERPYVCVECGHGFVHSSALAQHRRSHAGEKPYSCDECGKRFTARQQLRCHGRVHTGERPFICGQCGRTFAQSAYLTKHVRTHARAADIAAAGAGPRPPRPGGPRQEAAVAGDGIV